MTGKKKSIPFHSIAALAPSDTRREVRMHLLRRRILRAMALFLYCLALFIGFEFAYSAMTVTDPSRYRIFNPKYHHGLAPNFDGYDIWGNRSYRLLTNSLGFKDAEVREVAKQPGERRILLIGDS